MLPPGAEHRQAARHLPGAGLRPLPRTVLGAQWRHPLQGPIQARHGQGRRGDLAALGMHDAHLHQNVSGNTVMSVPQYRIP